MIAPRASAWVRRPTPVVPEEYAGVSPALEATAQIVLSAGIAVIVLGLVVAFGGRR